MSSKYPNLPGVNMNILDGQLLPSTNRSANSILIIAEARTNKTVPEGPVFVGSQDELVRNFGGFFYQGQLNPIAAQWAIATQNGLNNIYLMALKGATKKDQFVDLYDKLFGVMTDLQVSHVVLDGLYADEEITGLSAADFGVENIEEVTSLPSQFVYKGTTAYAPVDAPAILSIKVYDLEFFLTLPEGALNINQLQIDLQEALAVENVDLDANILLQSGNVALVFSEPVKLGGEEALAALGLTDVSVESSIKGNPAALIANFAETISEEIGETIAYIATKPLTSIDLASVKAHVEALVKRDNQVSPFLQVIAGPQVGITVPGNLRTQWVSGATHYAILVNSLTPQYATTNQPLPGITTLRYNLSPRQLNALVGNKYVTFKTSNNQVRVVDGVTTAPDLYVGQDIIKSDFTRLSTLRITNYVVGRIRTVCEVFIGGPNEFHFFNGMHTAIKAELDTAKELGIIQDASYSIKLGQALDAADISLTILPQFELRTINTTVALRRPDGF